jgi:hypothetical protein
MRGLVQNELNALVCCGLRQIMNINWCVMFVAEKDLITHHSIENILFLNRNTIVELCIVFI